MPQSDSRDDSRTVTNVLVIGRTGAGKSSLLNYLYGMDLPTGAGRPVTPFGIHAAPEFPYRGIVIAPFDSSGFEGGEQVDKWRDNLLRELAARNLQSVRDWFHTVLYCVSAEGERLDPGEEKLIREADREGIRVMLILTKCDLVSEDRLQIMEDRLRELFDPPRPLIRICSVSRKMRGGRITEPFGREQLFEFILLNFRRNLILKTLDLEHRLAEGRIHDMHQAVMAEFDRSVSLFTRFNQGFLRERRSFFQKLSNRLIHDTLEDLRVRTAEADAITSRVLNSYFSIDPGELALLFAGDQSDFSPEPSGSGTRLGDLLSFAPLFNSGGGRRLEFRRCLASDLMLFKSSFQQAWSRLEEKISRDCDSVSGRCMLLLPRKD